MRATPLLTALSLVFLPAFPGQASTFNQHCLESESIIASVRAAPALDRLQPKEEERRGEYCHYGQLSQEDVSQMESVQPRRLLLGEVCQYGQLSAEDLSQIQSVQPPEAVILLHHAR